MDSRSESAFKILSSLEKEPPESTAFNALNTPSEEPQISAEHDGDVTPSSSRSRSPSFSQTLDEIENEALKSPTPDECSQKLLNIGRDFAKKNLGFIERSASDPTLTPEKTKFVRTYSLNHFVRPLKPQSARTLFPIGETETQTTVPLETKAGPKTNDSSTTVPIEYKTRQLQAPATPAVIDIEKIVQAKMAPFAKESKEVRVAIEEKIRLFPSATITVEHDSAGTFVECSAERGYAYIVKKNTATVSDQGLYKRPSVAPAEDTTVTPPSSCCIIL